MRLLSAVARALLGMFVDDGSLALAVLAVIAVAAVLAFGFSAPPLLVGSVLALGCVAVLVLNVARAARSS
jgi:hypothetical protein